MFKEQLHTSFDSIKPAPELLDRISEMMSEEVSKKKPPLRMNVVKYGGIAAALMIAAGGTMLFMQSRDVNMGISNSARPEEAAYAEEEMLAAPAAAADAATAAYNDNGASENEADAEAAAESTEAAETAPVTTTAQNKNADSMDVYSAEKADETYYRQDDAAAAENGDIGDVRIASADDDMSDETYNDTADSYDDECDDADYGDEGEYCDEAAPESADIENPATGGAMYITSITDNDEHAHTGDSDALPVAAAYMPAPFGEQAGATGGDEHDDFWFPHTIKIRGIPVELMRLCGEKKVNAWTSDLSREPFMAGNPAVEGIEDYQNLYTFIRDMGLTRDRVYEGMQKYLESSDPQIKITREQLDTIISGNIGAINRMFASEYAIVKGDKVYGPHWVYTHDHFAYEAAGITKEDIAGKYELYKKLGLSDEAWKWFDEKLTYYMETDSQAHPVVRTADGNDTEWTDTDNDWAGTCITLYYPETDIMKYVRGEKHTEWLRAAEDIIAGALKPANVTIDHNSPDDYTIQIRWHPEADKPWTWYEAGILIWDDHGYLELVKGGKITVYILSEEYLNLFRA